MIGIIPTKDISQVWPEVLPLVEKAMQFNNGDLTIESVKERLESNNLVAWAHIKESVIQTICIVAFIPEMKTFDLLLCGGKGIDQALPEFMPKMKEFAAAQDAKRVRVHGRAGWKKMLKPYGFSEYERSFEYVIG